MHIYKLLLVLILLCSCGGGSSSSGIENNTQIIQSSNSTEVCINTQVANLKRCDLVHDNIDRFYYLYKPSNLDTNSSVAVLFALHGYGSSAMNHFNYTNYEPIANENNFIVVYPQGTTSNGLNTHWNNGGWTSKSTAKDILITSQLRSALIFNKKTKSHIYTTITISAATLILMLFIQLAF